MASETSNTTETVSAASIRSVLREQPFRRLWVTQALSQTAGHVVNFLLILKMFELTGSGFLASVLVVVLTLPTILFSSLAGVYADTFNRKYLLITSNLLRSVLVVLLSLFPTTPGTLLLFGFLLSSASQFFGPAQSAAIPQLVRRHQLFAANTLFMVTTYAAVLLGYILAGPLRTALGDLRTSSVLVVAFTLSALLSLQLPYFRDHLERQWGRSYLERAFRGIARDVREGIALLRRYRPLQALIILVSLLFAAERALIAILPNLAQNVLHLSVSEMSIVLVAPAGLGALIAAVLGTRLAHHVSHYTLMLASFVCVGASLLLLTLAPAVGSLFATNADLALYVGVLAMLCGGGSVLVIVAGQTLLHEQTPEATHGRMFGTLITFMNIIALPVILGVGSLTEAVSVPVVIGVLGVIVLGVGAVAAAIPHPRIGLHPHELPPLPPAPRIP